MNKLSRTYVRVYAGFVGKKGAKLMLPPTSALPSIFVALTGRKNETNGNAHGGGTAGNIPEAKNETHTSVYISKIENTLAYILNHSHK